METKRAPVKPVMRWNALRLEFELWDWPWNQTAPLRQAKWHFDWNRKVWVTSVLERAQRFKIYADPAARSILNPPLPKPMVK